MKNADMPAMPLLDGNGCLWNLKDGHDDSHYLGQESEKFSIGLTKRESLIQSLATRVDFAPNFYNDIALTEQELKIWARKVSMMADALLAEMEITK